LTAETTYLNSFEKEMVQEINLIRKDPSGYIPYILEYIQYMEKNGEFGNSIATANELVSALNQTPALDTLVPLKCLFDAAKKHAIDQKPTGDINHQGRDGLWPWDRALKACEDLTDGNENIVAGPPSVRRAVITLLVDDGIATRGHRANLLNPNWKYIACHQVGEIAGMPNYWIQMFGK
jgi:uncharacterized protein YkwD